MRILFANITAPINRLWLTLPMNMDNIVERSRILELTEGHLEENVAIYIAEIESPIQGLRQYIPHDIDLRELNKLAEKIEGMSKQGALLFSGALKIEAIQNFDDVLRLADCLAEYEYCPGINTMRDLGGYVVESGIMEFPQNVLPYLDYTGIGEEYHANHSGAFIIGGYVRRTSEPSPVQKQETRNNHMTMGGIQL